MRPHIGIALALAAAVLAAGCSSGKNVYAENPRLGQPALSVAAFYRRGNTICIDSAKRILALARPANGTALVAYLQDLEAIAEDEVRALEALRAPAGRRQEYAAFVLAARRNLALLQGPLHTAVQKGDFAALTQLGARMPERLRQTNELAARAGLGACALASRRR